MRCPHFLNPPFLHFNWLNCICSQFVLLKEIIKRPNILVFLPATTKLGQGNIFTSVCQEFWRVSASVHARIYPPPPEQTPPDQADTPRTWQTPPRTRQTTPPDQAEPPPPPRPGRHPPGPGRHPPPRKVTPKYGLRAAGTHPTGMHSCV